MGVLNGLIEAVLFHCKSLVELTVLATANQEEEGGEQNGIMDSIRMMKEELDRAILHSRRDVRKPTSSHRDLLGEVMNEFS